MVAGVGFEPTISWLCLPLRFSSLRHPPTDGDEFVVWTMPLPIRYSSEDGIYHLVSTPASTKATTDKLSLLINLLAIRSFSEGLARDYLCFHKGLPRIWQIISPLVSHRSAQSTYIEPSEMPDFSTPRYASTVYSNCSFYARVVAGATSEVITFTSSSRDIIPEFTAM